MSLPFSSEVYLAQQQSWPTSGRHILANFDDDTIIVYQAYSPAIGHFAAKNGYFGGDFSFGRMSWIKPNFLWMMYRSNWGQSPNQEVILAIRLRRRFFDSILEQSVPSSFESRLYSSPAEWKADVDRSNVRLQWDPDHDPMGNKLARRAIQLGLRGRTLEMFGKDEIVEIVDISKFVAVQRANAQLDRLKELVVPFETPYRPSDHTSNRIGLDLIDGTADK